MSDTALSHYLRLLRTNGEYTQDDLAKYLGVTRSTYSHYENARLMPSTDALYKLSSFYKVSLSKLIKLAVLSAGKANDDIKSAEYVITEDEIEQGSDKLYSAFLNECADMSPREISRWITIEDREIVYYYHMLAGREKRLMNYFMKLFILDKNNDE